LEGSCEYSIETPDSISHRDSYALTGKSRGKIPVGRPRNRWEDKI
jgi:hypothetical protein